MENRDIKFRGKRKDNGEWVYGCIGYGFSQQVEYIMPKMFFGTRDYGEVDKDGKMILEDTIAIGGFIPIIPASVGQYTGLKDKNGVDVYHKTIGFMKNFGCNIVIDFHLGAFGYWDGNEDKTYRQFHSIATHNSIRIENGVMLDFEIIGNTFDNPELIK